MEYFINIKGKLDRVIILSTGYKKHDWRQIGDKTGINEEK